MSGSPRNLAALVHFGRNRARGDVRRVASWGEVLRTAGFAVADVRLLPDLRTGVLEAARRLPSVATNPLVLPETLAWSPRRLRARLEALDASVVVCVTGRAFNPASCSGPWQTVLDYVDQLSVSYRDRSSIAPRQSARLLYRALAPAASRFEHESVSGTIRTAAGWADAQELGAWWLPNVAAPVPDSPSHTPDRDVLFVGTLSYPPNIAALERLARLWPLVLEQRPQTTALIAGANPTAEVAALAEARGWELVADFGDLDLLCRRASIAVTPLVHASGLQNKVIDAAAHGLAQVVDPLALAGVGPDFPALSAGPDPEFAQAIVRLLDDNSLRARLAAEGRRHVAATFSAERWAGWLVETLASTRET